MGYIVSSWAYNLREIVTPGSPEGFSRIQISDVYLADVIANPGNSGGPVYKIEDSSVIGICVSGRKTRVVDQYNKPVTIEGRKLYYRSGITYVILTQYIIVLLEKNGVTHTTVASAI